MEAKINQSRQVVPLGRIWWVILLGIFLATAANVVFYFLMPSVFQQPVFMNEFPPPEVSILDVSEVILFSVIFSTGASFVFVIVGNLSKHPVRTFLIISLVVLALSLALPLKLPSPPIAMAPKLGLVAMHIIGAIVVVGTLILLGIRRGE